MNYTRHAGGCCGISVVHNFDHASFQEFQEILDRHDGDSEHGTSGNRLLEAVLTDRQLNLDPNNSRIYSEVHNLGGWGVILAASGFRLVTRFRNSNTQRFCNVFHRVSRPLSLTDIPFSMEPVEPVESVDTIRWSEERLTTEVARVGLRVKYRTGVPGSTALRNNLIGNISSVSATTVYVIFVNSPEYNDYYFFDRFLYEVEEIQEVENEIEVDDEDHVQPEEIIPVLVRVEFYAIRHSGERRGPYTSEEGARHMWGRVHSYRRIEVYENQENVETVIFR